MPQVVIENLTKTFRIAERSPGLWGAFKALADRKYRILTALDSISFSLEKGEILGYIGPNGAGKSTTVKILSGILVPDSGKVEVLGYVPWENRIKTVRRIGVVFGQRTQLWWDLPVIESFDLLRDIYQLDRNEYKITRDKLIDLLDITPLLDTPVRQLSLGQRMRCDLTAALLHKPEILYLDEPTIGLDAINKIAVRDIIRQLNRDNGVTIILTTHDMDDIEALCKRVIVINQGRIFMDGTLDGLRKRVTRERRLIVHLANGGDFVDDPDTKVVSRDGRRITLGFDPSKISPADLIARITSKYNISDLFVENPPIEEIIAQLYGEAGK